MQALRRTNEWERERGRDGWMDGWTDRHIDRQIDRWTDRQTDRQVHLSLGATSISLRCIMGRLCHCIKPLRWAHLSSILHELQDVVVSKVCMRNSWKLLFPFSGQMFDLLREKERERKWVLKTRPFCITASQTRSHLSSDPTNQSAVIFS